MNKDINLSDCQVLFPESFSNKLQVYIQHYDIIDTQIANTQRMPSQAMNQCYGQTNMDIQSKPRLSSQKAEFLMLLSCQEFQETFENVFNTSEKWSFNSNEEDAELNEMKKDSRFLSWFALLKVPGLLEEDDRVTPWLSSSHLQKGDVTFVCGSPFGSVCLDIFMNTLSKGIVSNLAGEGNAVILTDARCLPGTEGGGLFIKKGDHFYLVGLIVSPLCWKANEWIGLTLVCSVEYILRNIRMLGSKSAPWLKEKSRQRPVTFTQVLSSGPEARALQNHPVVVLVECGQLWGSGVLMNSRIMLTCRHVVERSSKVIVKVRTEESFLGVVGEVIYSTKESSPFDVAVVLLKEQFPNIVVPALANSFKPGEDVWILGFGVFGQSCGPTLTAGILSRVVTCSSQPVMLQTTCAVQAGASGGAVIRASTGELLGLVSSNTRDSAARVTYPHLNFSVPVTVLGPLLQHFDLTEDAKVFEQLDRAGGDVRGVWRLQDRRSKL
ncbi:TYSD1 protease, partial [Amia calva]|nr:TYSD1 protease [Amia calva]